MPLQAITSVHCGARLRERLAIEIADFPRPVTGAHQPHMHNNTQRPDAAAASARLLPAATAPSGAARYALLDPLRHR